MLSDSSFWLGDIIVTSSASLTDPVLKSSELLAIVLGAAFIGLGGVKFIFSMVSLNLTNFLVLPNPTPYLESESLSLYRCFCALLPDFFITFSSFLVFSVSCAKF
jgi:hypothetical protein